MLKVQTMTQDQLLQVVNNACVIADIQDQYKDQVDRMAGDMYNTTINYLDADKFTEIQNNYPKLYSHLMKDNNMNNAIKKRKWNKVLYWLTNPYIIVVAFFAIFYLCTNDAWDDTLFGIILCTAVIFFVSRKFPAVGNFRRQLLDNGKPKFVDRVNRNLNVIRDAIQEELSDSVTSLMEQQDEKIISNSTALACYNIIPEDLRSSIVLHKLQYLLKNGLATSWKEAGQLAMQQIREDMRDSQTNNLLSQISDNVSVMCDNQLTLINQNDEIKAIMSRMENNQLTEINKLNQLNSEVHNVKNIAKDISRHTRLAADAALDADYRLQQGIAVNVNVKK